MGFGAMGGRHLRILASPTRTDVQIEAVVDPDPLRLEEAMRGRADWRAYASLDEALADETLDFACVATPIRHLAPCSMQALREGLHVFVEKPMAATSGEAQLLVDEAERLGRVLTVGLVERCNPAVIALKRMLSEGHAGRVVQMHARRLSPFPNRSQMKGVALDLATHDVDVMRYISEAEVERVFAETAAGIGPGDEDLVCATLRFEGGTTGLLESNWITPTKVRQLAVTGESGMFVVDYLTQDLTFYEHPTKPSIWEPLAGMLGGGEGNVIQYALERREPLQVEWEGFVAAVCGQGSLPANGRDGVAALSTAEAIQRSGIRHEVVTPAYRQALVA